MRKLMLAAVAGAAIATPAAARDGNAYAGLELGPMLVQDIDLDYDDPNSDIDDALSLDYKTGYDVDVIGGYDFGMFRVEGELGFKRASLSNIKLANEIAAPPFTGGGEIDPNSGSGRMLSAMINGLVDFGDEGATGYFGGGIGMTRVRLSGSFDGTFPNIPGTEFSFSDSDSAFALQLIAGVRLPVSSNIDLGLKYRFFHTTKFDLEDESSNAELSGKWKSHSFLLSAIYNFGGPEAAPPAPPPPPPPPPPTPATQTCPDGSVILATEACPAPPPPPPPPPPAPERG